MSKLPIYLSLLVLAALLAVVWYWNGMNGKADERCGKTLTGLINLEDNLFCSSLSLSNAPAGSDEGYAFTIEENGTVLDCGQATIAVENGRGIFVHNAENVTIKNCQLQGPTVGIYVEGARNLTLDGLDVTAKTGAISLHDSSNVRIQNCRINGASSDAQWGIEVFGGSGVVIDDATIATFQLSGINFYGSENFTVSNSNLSYLRDTGIGVFQNSDGKPCKAGKLVKNNIRWIHNVGAFEILHGATGIHILDNEIEQTVKGLAVYEPGRDGLVKGLVFSGNKVDSAQWAVAAMDMTDIKITRNEITGCSGGLFDLKKIQSVLVEDNLFKFNKGAGVIGPEIEQFEFHKNRFEKHFETFLDFQQSPQLFSLSENYWDGCPSADRFKNIAFPKDINPIQVKVYSYEDTVSYDLADANGDGKDDKKCIPAVTENSPPKE